MFQMSQRTQFEDAAGEDDDAVAERQEGGVARVEARVPLGHDGHEGGWADSDSRNAAQEDVHEAPDERGVEAVLGTNF